MSRATLAVTRVAAAVLGLVLVAAGLAALAWWSDRFPGLPQKTDLNGLIWLPQQAWWPWALLAAGAVMTLLGLRWLAGHIPHRAVGQIQLPGSGPDGHLLVNAGTVATAAADALAATPGVRSATGTIHRDRGQLVAKLTATIEREADLHLVAAAADTVTADLRHALQRDDMVARVQLRAAGRNRPYPESPDPSPAPTPPGKPGVPLS